MKKNISMVTLLLCVFVICVNAQNNKQPYASSDLVFGKCDSCPSPLLIFDGINSNQTLNTITPDTIGTIFSEGNSSYVRQTYSRSLDSSLMRKYFGKEGDKGGLFIFTKDKVQTIAIKKLKQCLKNGKCKMLFKIDNEPLTENYHELDIDKIQMIKDFSLTHWNTGVVDSFTLFVIKSKK